MTSVRHFPSTLLFLLLALCSMPCLAQAPYRADAFRIARAHRFDPTTAAPDFSARLQSIEAPRPDGNSVKSYVMRQKIEARKRFPRRAAAMPKTQEAPAQPLLLQSFGMTRKFPNGTIVNLGGGIPNDNSLAVSDSGVVLAGINSLLYAYRMADSTRLFTNATLSLSALGGGGINNDYYDPKLLYDPLHDRFIAVFLRNFDPQTSAIVVCFSTSHDPTAPWNVYYLPGNPLNNNRWTDFPAIAITATELLVTANLIIPDVSWQEGFDGSVIWQMRLDDGYSGADSVDTRLYSGIRYNNRFIRNLYPVPGAYGWAEDRILLSNRNFDLQNDTVFVLKVHSSIDEADSLEIRVTRTDLPYGMPPNGRQTDTDTADATSGLQTNDARVLAGVLYDNTIQYVANCMQPQTGLSCIYHGLLRDATGNTQITGRYIDDPHLDFGYPNIALAGNEACDGEAIIGFNYAAPDSFPGVACRYFSNDSLYSDLMLVKTGESYVDRLPGGYERWGDYFGTQRIYGRQAQVVLCGYYGMTGKNNGTWFAHLQSPDSSKITALFQQSSAGSGPCGIRLDAQVSGGKPPYSYEWNGQSGSSSYDQACAGQTVALLVRDARGCVYSDSVTVQAQHASGTVYPNPFIDQFRVQIAVPADGLLQAELIDAAGRRVALLLDKAVKAGSHELSFATLPLAAGSYFLRVQQDGTLLGTWPVVRSSAP